MTYGTGAIMAVPGHDTRDWEFAKKFGLPIIGWIITLVAMRDCPLTKEEMVHVQKRIAEKKAAARAELFAEQLK